MTIKSPKVFDAAVAALATHNVVTNDKGQLRSVEGPQAIEAYRIKVLISGLKLEMSGMRVSRGVNCLKLAKQLTGLKTNDRERQIYRLQHIFNNALSKVLIVEKGEGE